MNTLFEKKNVTMKIRGILNMRSSPLNRLTEISRYEVTSNSLEHSLHSGKRTHEWYQYKYYVLVGDVTQLRLLKSITQVLVKYRPNKVRVDPQGIG